MTTEELHHWIREQVLASPDLKAKALAGVDNAIAEALRLAAPSVPKFGSMIGERGIYAELGGLAGETYLQSLEGLAIAEVPHAAIFKRALRWLADPIGLDVGVLETQQVLLAYSGEGKPLPMESTLKLIAFGSQSQTITVDDVSNALSVWRPDGQCGPIKE